MKKPSHLKALIIAILVTIIWSTSWILIKIGLVDVPAVTFAGLRYFLASLFFLPLLIKKDIRRQIRGLTRRDWLILAGYGFVLYFIAQAGQYLGLAYLPSVTVMLILNLNALFVAFSSGFLLNEKINWLQWIGVFLNLAGIAIYFNPTNPIQGHWLGWFFAILSLVGNLFGTVLGRQINREARINPIVITGISMLIGSIVMLATGIAWQGLPPLSTQSIWIIILLSMLNTAVCFTLWNYTQQVLLATETSIIGNTMLIYVAILAWIFLGERQTALGIVGLALSLVGAVFVQIRLKPNPKVKNDPPPDML